MSEIVRMVVLICGVATAEPDCTVDRSIQATGGPIVGSVSACRILAALFE
jgi:hypothetical protein